MKRATFIEGVRAMRPGTKVLYLSGYAGDTLQANVVQDDMPFPPKPFLPTTLIETGLKVLLPASPR